MYTVPTTFAAENGDQPATQIDACNAALLEGINNAYLVGTLGVRPLPDGVGNGRYYFATDTQQLFRDNGTAWVPVAPAVSAVSIGLYGSRGLTGINNAGTPNTKMDFSADAIQVFDPASLAITPLLSVATQTCDITLAGPVVNGRDQAGAFTNGSFVYFYEIYNPSTTAKGLIASATGWPTGPVLPAGYTRWSPLAPVYLSAGGALLPVTVQGNWVSYQAHQSALAGGASTIEAAINLAALVPPNAQEIELTSTASSLGNTVTLRYLTGVDYRAITHPTYASGIQTYQDFTRMPVRGQQMFYLVSGLSTSIDILGYGVPNGGS